MPVEVITLLDDPTCIVVKKAFSKKQCLSFLGYANGFNVALSHYPTTYRNNERFFIDNPQLAGELLETIRTCIPNILQGSDDLSSWAFKKLNPRIRFCKYNPGQYFNKHLDGVYYESQTVQSKLTFMVYLNGHDEFEGGETLFFSSKASDEVIQTFLPETGDLIIFDHNIWHSGKTVTSEEKFVLRSDILYEKITVPPTINSQTENTHHLGYIWCLLLLDSNFFLSTGRDKTIKCWNLSGNLICSVPSQHTNSIFSIVKMGKTSFIAASRDSTISLWEFSVPITGLNLKEKYNNGRNEWSIISICKIDDLHFASGGADGIIDFFTVGQMSGPSASWKLHSNWVWKIIHLFDNVFCSVSEDCRLIIWDLNKNILCEHEDDVPITCCAFDGVRLYFGLHSGTVKSMPFDPASRKGKVDESWLAHPNSIIRCLKVYKNRNLLITGGEDNSIALWDATNCSLIQRLVIHSNFVQDFFIERDILVSASYDGQIKYSILP